MSVRFKVIAGLMHDVWIVEGIDCDSEGEMLWAEFSGCGAQERARDYAQWMNSKSVAQQAHHQCNPISQQNTRMLHAILL